MQQELDYRQHVEYFPIGEPRRETDRTLDDIDFRASNVVFVSNRAGTDFLQLTHTPVSTLSLRVHEDPNANAGQASTAFGSDTLLSFGDDYWLDVGEEQSLSAGTIQLSKSGILRRQGAWPVEPRSVKVEYYGGWTAEQLAGRSGGAVKLAALKTVANAYWGAKANATSAGRGAGTSESIGKYSVGYAAIGSANLQITIPDSAKADLWPFRNLGRLFG
jgi:hypothetical protein